MPPKRRANDGILGRKGGGNCGPPTRHLGRKRARRVVGGVQQPARYPTRRVAMAEIIKYRRHGGYLIPKAPFYWLCQEIVSDLALEQQFCWHSSNNSVGTRATILLALEQQFCWHLSNNSVGSDQLLNASRWQRKRSW